MSILILAFCIAFLIIQIVWFKINAFVAFITTFLLAGIFLDIPINSLSHTVQKGLGEMLGSITLIIVCGTCIGKLTVSSGAVGAGSLMYSHVNDPGFWMFKEYLISALKTLLNHGPSWNH